MVARVPRHLRENHRVTLMMILRLNVVVRLHSSFHERNFASRVSPRFFSFRFRAMFYRVLLIRSYTKSHYYLAKFASSFIPSCINEKCSKSSVLRFFADSPIGRERNECVKLARRIHDSLGKRNQSYNISIFNNLFLLYKSLIVARWF